jgi:nitroimidazol reductase NimA-like FMN-containing flavoprotein (pyridoxamine 5'-phosphate oxidase superfamily)
MQSTDRAVGALARLLDHGMSGEPTERTRVRRIPEKAAYDRATLNKILDDALICHVGFVEDGAPFVIPTMHARVGRTLYFHGSPASRMLRLMKRGAQVTVAVTILDGIVAARSVFHHSMHYRSAVVMGQARVVDDPAEREVAFEAIANAALPGRWDEARHPSRSEDKGTLLVAVPIEEFSSKVSEKDVGDEPEDYGLPIWAGVIPLSLTPGTPEPDDRLVNGIVVPPSVRRFVGEE